MDLRPADRGLLHDGANFETPRFPLEFVEVEGSHEMLGSVSPELRDTPALKGAKHYDVSPELRPVLGRKCPRGLPRRGASGTISAVLYGE